MKKKASDYQVGELLVEFDGRPADAIISMMDDPYRITRAYILTRSAIDGSFSIYACLKDAMCEPNIARSVPEEVMRQFLWDAFVGMELWRSPEKPEFRVPLQDGPKYEKVMKAVPLKQVETREKMPFGGEEKPTLPDPPSSMPMQSQVPDAEHQEEPVPESGRMLPELEIFLR
jgi:hypothetical protein